jgi:hypothetical protein
MRNMHARLPSCLMRLLWWLLYNCKYRKGLKVPKRENVALAFFYSNNSYLGRRLGAVKKKCLFHILRPIFVFLSFKRMPECAQNFLCASECALKYFWCMLSVPLKKISRMLRVRKNQRALKIFLRMLS